MASPAGGAGGGTMESATGSTSRRCGLAAAGLRGALAACLLLALAGRACAQDAAPPAPVTEVAAGVFVHMAPYQLATPRNLGFIGNAGFIIGRDAVAVIDTGGSLRAGAGLRAAIRLRTPLPIRYVINTHVHPDHVLGNAAFVAEGPEFVGHAALPEALAARQAVYLAKARELMGDEAFAGTRAIPPTRLVADTLTLDLGDRPLLLEAWPLAHSGTDLTVMDVRTGTWFLGDLLFAGHVPALDGNAMKWIALLDRLKQREAARVVPGHGPAALSWPEAALPTERYLRRLVADVRHLIQQGRPMAEAGRSAASEAGEWALFDAFNPRNAVTTFHDLEWE